MKISMNANVMKSIEVVEGNFFLRYILLSNSKRRNKGNFTSKSN